MLEHLDLFYIRLVYVFLLRNPADDCNRSVFAGCTPSGGGAVAQIYSIDSFGSNVP